MHDYLQDGVRNVLVGEADWQERMHSSGVIQVDVPRLHLSAFINIKQRVIGVSDSDNSNNVEGMVRDVGGDIRNVSPRWSLVVNKWDERGVKGEVAFDTDATRLVINGEEVAKITHENGTGTLQTTFRISPKAPEIPWDKTLRGITRIYRTKQDTEGTYMLQRFEDSLQLFLVAWENSRRIETGV